MQAGQAKLAMCDDTCGSLIQLSQPTRTLVCGFSRTYRASSARATEDLALRPLGCLASARCEQERNLRGLERRPTHSAPPTRDRLVAPAWRRDAAGNFTRGKRSNFTRGSRGERDTRSCAFVPVCSVVRV
jgi:hypothetical protein